MKNKLSFALVTVFMLTMANLILYNKLFKKVVQATPKDYKDRSRLKGLSGS
jgi:hypothetical protein